MQKILYIVTQKDCGGAQKNVVDLALNLKHKHEVKVAAGPDGGRWLFDELQKNGIQTIELKKLHRAINLFADYSACLEIKKLLEEEKPDILHLHSSKTGFLGSLASILSDRKIKTFYTSHGAAFASSFGPTKRKVFLWTEKISARWKNKIICVSNNEKEAWLKNKVAPEKKLTVIPNGIDFKKITFLPKEEARKKIAIGRLPVIDNQKIIGTIANFFPDKGLLFLFEAASLVCQKKSDVTFTIIGDGPQRNELEKIIKKYRLENKILLLGQIPNAILYLKAFDLYVQPSIKEGFGYTILEALTAELPVISTKVGGAKEMIEEGQNGLLVPPKNAMALAEEMLKLIESPDLRQKLAQNSRQKIQEFSVEKMIEKTEKIYSEK